MAARGLETLFHPVGEAGELTLFLVEALNDLHRAQRLGHHRTKIGDPVLVLSAHVPHAAHEHDKRDHDQRHRQNQQQRQARGQHQQIANAANDHDRVPERNRDGRADDILDPRGVGGHPAGDFLWTVFLEEARRQAQQVFLHVAPDIGDHPFAQYADEIEAQPRAQPQNDDDHHEVAEPAADLRRVAALGKAAVDDQAKAGRNRQRCCGGGDECDQGGSD